MNWVGDTSITSSISESRVGSISSIEESRVSLSLSLAISGISSIGIGSSGTWDWNIGSIHTGGRFKSIGQRVTSIAIGSIEESGVSLSLGIGSSHKSGNDNKEFHDDTALI